LNDECPQLPLPTVAGRARRSTMWLCDGVQRRSAPPPNRIRLRRCGSATDAP
jgi:hypothetical protein